MWECSVGGEGCGSVVWREWECSVERGMWECSVVRGRGRGTWECNVGRVGCSVGEGGWVR